MEPQAKIRRYKRLSPRMFERLHNDFTFEDGGLRYALTKNEMLHMFVAFQDKKIVGWAGVYNGMYNSFEQNVYSIGVWVDCCKRHCGIGGELRRKAAMWAIKNGLNRTYWYDSKNEWECKIIGR